MATKKQYYASFLLSALVIYAIGIASPLLTKISFVPGSLIPDSCLDDSINIICDDYFAGEENIIIISNITNFYEYSLYIDDLLLDSRTRNALSEGKTLINATHAEITRGHFAGGSISDLCIEDGVNLHIHPKSYGHSRMARIYVGFAMSNKMSSLDISDLNFTLSLGNNGYTTSIQVKNGSHFVNIAANSSLNAIQLDAFSNSYLFKVDFTGHENFEVKIDQFVLNANQDISVADFYFISGVGLDSALYSDGIHRITTNMTTPGNQITREKEICIDNTKPIIDDIFTSPATKFNDAMTSICGTIIETNIASVMALFELDNETITIPLPLSTSFNVTMKFPTGLYNLFVLVSDLSGNTVSSNISFEVSPKIEIQHVYLPNIELSYPSMVYTNIEASISMIMLGISEMNLYLNDSIVHSTINATSASHSFTSPVACVFNACVELYHANGTFYKNITFMIEFKERIHVLLPQVTMIVPVETITGQVANATFAVMNGAATLYVDGVANTTIMNETKSILFTRALPGAVGLVLEVWHSNGSFFVNYSAIITFKNMEMIIQPLVEILHAHHVHVGELTAINITMEKISTMNLYLNDSIVYSTINTTSASHSFTSPVACVFNACVELYHANGTFYKNITFMIEFKERIHVLLPQVTMILPVETITSQVANATFAVMNGAATLYVDGVANTTIMNETKSILFTRALPGAVGLVLEVWHSNGSFFVNYSTSISFIEPIIVVKIIPSYELAYSGIVYLPGSAWMNISTAFMSKVDVYINSTFNQTVVGNISARLDFTLGKGTYNLQARFFNSSSVNYVSVNFTIFILEFSVNQSEPVVQIIIPKTVDSLQDINIMCFSSLDANITILIDGVLVNNTIGTSLLHSFKARNISGYNVTCIVDLGFDTIQRSEHINVRSRPNYSQAPTQQGVDVMLIIVIGLSTLCVGLALKKKN